MIPLHPALVHIAVAFLPIAFILELYALAFKKKNVSAVAWWNQVIGTIGVGLAIYSGLQAEKTARFSATTHEILERHEQIAFVVGAVVALLLLWRMGTRGNLPDKLRWLYMVLYAAGVAALLFGAWHGGELVFGHGVGVQP